MKTKLIWIMGLALLLAGCGKETFEPNNTNSGGDGVSVPTKLTNYSSAIFTEVTGAITFGIKTSDPVTVWWQDTGIWEVINPSEDMQYISHTFLPGPDWVMTIYNLESVTEFVCKNSGLRSISFWTETTTALTKIDCSNNPELHWIDILGNHSSLQEVYCNNNNLSMVNFDGNFPLMRVLECMCNNLSSLDCTDINNIQRLDVCVNNLTSLDCSGMNNLQYLLADCNALTSVDLDGCYLRTVSFACNYLDYVDFTNALSGSNTFIYLWANPFESSYAKCQAIANTIGQTNGFSMIYTGTTDAANWMRGICGPKGWTVSDY